MNAPEELNESFDIEDSEDIIGLAKSLIDGQHAGVLATVEAGGLPDVRWMSTLAFHEFPKFYTLTSPESRKVQQIKRHPKVCWMFFNADRSLILNLTGTATIHEDTRTLKRVWKQVEDKSHAYFLRQYVKGAGFVVIETTVDHISCTSPQNGLRLEVEPKELAHTHYPI